VTLRLDGVMLSLAGRTLVPGLSLAVAPGEAATVMGPSGCGKSTLLAWMTGALDRRAFRAEGRLWCGAEELTGLAPYRRRLGILFQDDLLFPHLSVGDNLLFGLDPAVRGRAARWAAVAAVLERAEMPAEFARRDPATLSGGQRARVALLRVLLSRPRALLLDEPFSKLDAGLRDRFRRLVLDEARARGLPVLLVTHDPADAEAAGGAVVRLGGGQAAMEEAP
jgi:putative thiamine transport system ATP-binding protein